MVILVTVAALVIEITKSESKISNCCLHRDDPTRRYHKSN